jgi:hypothetical protein
VGKCAEFRAIPPSVSNCNGDCGEMNPECGRGIGKGKGKSSMLPLDGELLEAFHNGGLLARYHR